MTAQIARKPTLERSAPLVMNIAAMQPDADGLADFVWPVSYPELVSVREAILPEIPMVARRHLEAVGFLEILGHFLAREVLSVFYATALIERAGNRGQKIIPSPHNRLIGPVLAGQVPELPGHLRFLMRGYPVRPKWKVPLRLVRDLFTANDDLRRQYLGTPDFASRIIACGSGRLISQHASRISEPVTFLPLNEWFGEVEATTLDVARRKALGLPVIEDLMARVGALFAARDLSLSDPFASYLRNWLTEAAALWRVRAGELKRRPHRLPARLWTGTGGQVFARLLRQAVRENGGHVTGHDHAYGSAMYRDHTKTLNDLEVCDRFITFSPAQVEGLRKTARRDHLIQPQLPEIDCLPDTEGRAVRAGIGRNRGPIRRIIYVMDMYSGDLVRLLPSLADPVALDWQARLLAKLREWGYEVEIKPHPESPIPTPPRLAELAGRPVLGGFFEEHLSTFDAVLIDNPFTTTFGQALRSDRAVVFIDFGIGHIRDDLRDMFSRRCRLVEGRFDDRNRAQVEWDDLARAIPESRDLQDTTFADRFLVGID